MNERMRELREMLGLSQKDFAAALGVSRGVIANIEQNLTKPKPPIVSLVCQTYNVSEKWLRDGEGDPFIDESETDEIMRFVNSLMSDEPDNDFKRRFIASVVRMSPEGWDALQHFIDSLK